MNQELAKKSIGELAPLIQSKQLSPVEITESVLYRVEQYDGKINSYIRVDAEDARKSAKLAENEIMKGIYKGKLHGIPMALKDIFYTKGKIVTMGSKIHKDFIPSYDATVVQKLAEAGAVFTGTLNMHEYAWGGTTNNPHYGPCRNPWNLEKIPGGSSGGSGAAVIADLTIASLGTDTGGSVRIPASVCGIVGLKPTHGRVSKHGVFPLGFSLDHVGPMTKTVQDAAILLEAIAGFDQNDPTTIQKTVLPYSTLLTDDIKGMVIGIEEDFYLQNIQPGVESLFYQAIETLKDLGAVIKPVKLPSLQNSFYAEMITILAEASAIHHNNLKTRPEDFGKDVRLSLELGELPSAVEYVQAQQIRYQMKNEFQEIFKTVDTIVAPTLPFTAPYIGQEISMLNNQQLSTADELVRLQSPANLTGFPSISVPCGFSENMPAGIQFIGNAFDEQTILKAAYAFERTNPTQHKKPELEEITENV
ncbi:amidase [Bacillus massiliglaciei]|uniref:amidase n=1 Tax=Bacillus massiliglaciei TaxID=1816693 RepID=UPI000A958955|nr:amidase [Bacillus massiliglaciei]